MNTRKPPTPMRVSAIGLLMMSSAVFALAHAKRKANPASPDDPTARVFQLLDDSYSGKLRNFCLLAGTYSNPGQPDQVLEHVLQVNYDKTRFFGRFRISVRGVSQLTPAQLKEYTPDQIYGFGSDVAKFEKINPGPFGEAGDLYFRANAQGALAQAPITGDAIAHYDSFLTQYIVPALQKS
jgi:hypothetical protein